MKIKGTGKADKLVGTASTDTISGGNGNDWIEGGIGNDILTGGDGADKFILRAGGGQDVITDFDPNGGDRVLFDVGGGYSDILYFGQLHDDLTFGNGYGTASFTINALDFNSDGIMDTEVLASTGDSVILLGFAPEDLYGWSLMGG